MSFEVSEGIVFVRSDDTVRELVRIAEIHSWSFPSVGEAAVRIGLSNGQVLIVGDQRGTLCSILQQVAGAKRVAYEKVGCEHCKT